MMCCDMKGVAVLLYEIGIQVHLQQKIQAQVDAILLDTHMEQVIFSQMRDRGHFEAQLSNCKGLIDGSQT